MSLKIGSNLQGLPLSFVTLTQAIVAKKRVGKSYTASVQAEEMLKAGQQIVIIDVTGAWSGLRSSADGKSAGFPILIAGGERGDIPLEKTGGEVMASSIVKEGFSCILDLSFFRKGETITFLADFLSTLYRLNREPLHLFCDEADYYCPQKPFGNEAVAVGALDDVVRRGGIRGIGTTLITQRPAALNKNVLTQCEVLTALRISYPHDIKAIKDWIDVHGDHDKAIQMIKRLPELPIGTAWMWSPAWPDENGIFQEVKIRRRETFDSGATPKAGQKKSAAKVLAPIDIEKLGTAIKQTAEQAKENDPKRLKAEIAKLKLQSIQPAQVKVERIEVPAISPETLQRISTLAGEFQQISAAVQKEFESVRTFFNKIPNVKAPAPTRPIAPRREALAPVSDGDTQIGKGERKILTAVAQSGAATREQLTILTGYKQSSRDTYLQRLQYAGLVEKRNDALYATKAGVAALGPDFEPLPIGDALRRHWMQTLPEGERKILEVVAARYPDAVRREDISEATGYRQSSRDTYLQRLGARRLVVSVRRGEVSASDILFDN